LAAGALETIGLISCSGWGAMIMARSSAGAEATLAAPAACSLLALATP
jgi:hypothetical protein